MLTLFLLGCAHHPATIAGPSAPPDACELVRTSIAAATDGPTARAAVRAYLQCVVRTAPRPDVADEVRTALDTSAYPALQRDAQRVYAGFFDKDALKDLPDGPEELEAYAQTLADQQLVARATGDTRLEAAIGARLERIRFLQVVIADLEG
jgi:hypothetical protein